MMRRRPPVTVQATANRWAVVIAAESIVTAEWLAIPENVRLVTEARGLVGDAVRGLER